MNVGETDCITYGLVPEVELRLASVKRRVAGFCPSQYIANKRFIEIMKRFFVVRFYN